MLASKNDCSAVLPLVWRRYTPSTLKDVFDIDTGSFTPDERQRLLASHELSHLDGRHSKLAFYGIFCDPVNGIELTQHLHFEPLLPCDWFDKATINVRDPIVASARPRTIATTSTASALGDAAAGACVSVHACMFSLSFVTHSVSHSHIVPTAPHMAPVVDVFVPATLTEARAQKSPTRTTRNRRTRSSRNDVVSSSISPVTPLPAAMSQPLQAQQHQQPSSASISPQLPTV